jgi:hypothetical protein
MPPRHPDVIIDQLKKLVVAYAFLVNVIAVVVTVYAAPNYWKQDYHNSQFRGLAWVKELIHGHPDRIRSELGVRLHVFITLVEQLRTLGLKETQFVTVEEQVAIFLYMVVTGLSVRHVGERFQRANATISKYE